MCTAILMLRRVCFCSCLEVSESERKTESNFVVTSTFVLLETPLPQNLSSLNTSASSYLEQSTHQVKVQVRLVSLLQCAKTLIRASTALRQVLLCLLTTESVASMNSTRWTRKIKPQSTKLWSSKQFLSQRQAFMLPLTLELRFWLLRILSSADTTVRNLSGTT